MAAPDRAEALNDEGDAEAAARLRRIVSHLPIFAGALSPAGVVLDYSYATDGDGTPLQETVVGREFALCDWWNYDADSIADIREGVQAVAKGEAQRKERPYRRPDGTMGVADCAAVPIHDARGKVREIVVTGIDVTHRVQHQQETELLARELRHRLGNTLAVVGSIANLSFRPGMEMEEIKEGFFGRLTALSLSHDLLGANRWSGADLEAVVTRAIAPFGWAGDGIFTAEGPEGVPVSPRAAMALGLALHELATNAMKHGALGTAEGCVAIRWSRKPFKGREGIALTWQESGGPPVPETPEREGFGSILLQRTLRMDLRGECEVDFDPAGLRFRCHFPAATA